MVRNYPGSLGLNLKETVIFGKRLHGPVMKGLTVDRNPATGCTARILDKDSREHIAHLWWHMPRDGNNVQQVVDIGPGQDADLMLFARTNADRSSYFVYQNKNGILTDAVEPPEDAKFRESKQFVVQIRYTYGRQSLEFEIAIQKHYAGGLTYTTCGRGGSL